MLLVLCLRYSLNRNDNKQVAGYKYQTMDEFRANALGISSKFVVSSPLRDLERPLMVSNKSSISISRHLFKLSLAILMLP